MFFVELTKRIGILLIHSHWMVMVVLAVVIFWLDNLREKKSVPRLNSQELRVLEILVAHPCACCATQVENL